jgi:hypothetical protein
VDELYHSQAAESEFRSARFDSFLSSIFAKVLGRSDKLLSLEEAREILPPKAESYVGTRVVQTELIVGSEGRYNDFNRHFLPKQDFLSQRWKRVSVAYQQDKTLPPVQLYELAGLYFIRDGNHRVAVAKRRKVEFIEAEVTSLATEFSVPPVGTREDLLRAVLDYEHKRFLELLPTADIRFTTTGRYDDLAVHIACHRALLTEERGMQPTLEEATRSWHEEVYLPITQFIRDSKVLAQHPERTEADFYVWLVRHWDEALVAAGS